MAIRHAVVALMLLAPAMLAVVPAATPQAKPSVRIGYLPTDSFAALYILGDRHLPAAGVGVEMVRLAGGPEILSQVATGQLQVGAAGMGAAGFNAVASGLPVEFVAPQHSGYLADYFTVRKASWGKEIKRIADLRGKPIALNVRGAAVEWMLEEVLKLDGLTLKDVQIRLMPFPDMVPALESGAVEAGIVSEPFPTLAEERGVALRPLTRPADAKATPITAIFWNKDWAAKNPDLAQQDRLRSRYRCTPSIISSRSWLGMVTRMPATPVDRPGVSSVMTSMVTESCGPRPRDSDREAGARSIALDRRAGDPPRPASLSSRQRRPC